MTAAVERTAEFQQLLAARGVHADVGTPPRLAQSAFLVEAAVLLQSVQGLEELVRTVEPQYVQPARFIRGSARSRMSDHDKDTFDAEITELVKDCCTRIDALQNRTQRPHASTLLLEHEKEMITYLLERLKGIATTAKRLQKQRSALPFLLSRRLLPEEARLALADREDALAKAGAKMKEAEVEAEAEAEVEARATSLNAALEQEGENGSDSHKQSKSQAQQLSRIAAPPTAGSAASSSAHTAPPTSTSTKTRPFRPAQKPRRPVITETPLFASQQEDLEFTEEQGRRFHMENVTLHRHFQENLEDAKQMESKMAEISNLMGQFADKIMDQQYDIEMIHQHAKETSSNVKQSNKILEQTQNIGRGYGFMIFCFYAGFSLLLHMLHYFNN